jgi:galactonate dehydratase
MVQEICGAVQTGERDKIWQELVGIPALRMVNGRYPLPEKPGLGIDVSEAVLKKYPFQGTRYFQTAFEEDGAVASL